MESRNFADVLANCVFKDQENLRLACLIEAHLDEIRRRIIVPFTEALTFELYKRLDQQQWDIENPFRQHWPPKTWNDLSLTRRDWENRYCVYLQTNRLRDVCMGIKKKAEISWPTDDAPLRSRIDKQLVPDLEPTGGINQQYVWSFLKPPYRDWADMQCLSNMHWQKETTADMFASLLVRVVKVASDLLDGKTE